MPQIMVSYEAPDAEDSWQEEYAFIWPQIGQGVVDRRGRRWRVRDVWVVYEKHGAVEYGVYAFITPAVGAEDRMLQIDPQYYGPPAG